MSRKLALALFGAVTLVALPLCYAQGGDAAKDRRDIRKDRQDIRQDKRERREDRRELRQDIKSGDTQSLEAAGMFVGFAARSCCSAPVNFAFSASATVCAISPSTPKMFSRVRS